jgi:hypothetical protein
VQRLTGNGAREGGTDDFGGVSHRDEGLIEVAKKSVVAWKDSLSG